MVDFSFVIVTYLSHDLIKDCLESIKQHCKDRQTYEIIIVDNSDTVGHEMLTTVLNDHLFNTADLKIIHNPSNSGYGAGNNLGIKAAVGKIIAIMNPDVRLTEPLLEDAQSKFTNNSNLAWLSYKQTGGFDYSFYMKPEHRGFLAGWQMKLANKRDVFSPDKFYLSGAFFFIDKAKFEKVGLFDETIFLYFEEPDVTNRLLKQGYDILYDNQKSYIHLVGDRIGFSEFGFKHEMISLKYYLKKYNINTNDFLSSFKMEYRIKWMIAKLINDKKRIHKFEQELEVINSTFG